MEFLKKLGSFFGRASTNRTLSLLLILAVIAAIPLTVYVAQQQQETQQQAARDSDCYNSCIGKCPLIEQFPSAECLDSCDAECSVEDTPSEPTSPPPPPRPTNPSCSPRTYPECCGAGKSWMVTEYVSSTTGENEEYCPPYETSPAECGNPDPACGEQESTQPTPTSGSSQESPGCQACRADPDCWNNPISKEVFCPSVGGNTQGSDACTTCQNDPMCNDDPIKKAYFCNSGTTDGCALCENKASCKNNPAEYKYWCGACKTDSSSAECKKDYCALCEATDACKNNPDNYEEACGTAGGSSGTGGGTNNCPANKVVAFGQCVDPNNPGDFSGRCDNQSASCSPCETCLSSVGCKEDKEAVKELCPAGSGGSGSPGGSGGTTTQPATCPVLEVFGKCGCEIPLADLLPVCKDWKGTGTGGSGSGGSGSGGGNAGGGGSGGPGGGSGSRTSSPTSSPLTSATSQPKTCSIASTRIANGNTVEILYGGNARKQGAEPVRLWITSKNLQKIPGLENIERNYSGGYYYLLDTCESSNNTACTQDASVTLPKGTYSFHCDLAELPNRCSGNPNCTYKGGNLACADWVACSPTDYKDIQISQDVSGPTNVPGLSGTPTEQNGSGGLGSSSFNPCDIGLTCITPKPTRP